MSGTCPIQVTIHGHWIDCTFPAGHDPWLHSWQTPGDPGPFVFAPSAGEVRNRDGGPLGYPYDTPGLRPQVGVGVFCWRDGKFLMQRRGRKFGTGRWSVPGGAQEHGETFEEAGAREVWEETGLTVTGLSVVKVTNDMAMPLGGEHWITVWLTTSQVAGEPQVSDEATEYRWCTFGDLPAPLFQPHWQNFLAPDGFPRDIGPSQFEWGQP